MWTVKRSGRGRAPVSSKSTTTSKVSGDRGDDAGDGIHAADAAVEPLGDEEIAVAVHSHPKRDQEGLNGQAAVYLDVSHIDRETLDRKLEGILEIDEKFCGVDPREEPMKVFPGMHYTMGGMWVNAVDQATNVPGIYAAGECEYQYHGANRLGANSLVSCIFGGGIAGPAAVKYAKNLGKGTASIPSTVFDREKKRQDEKNQALLSQDGSENPMTIWK